MYLKIDFREAIELSSYRNRVEASTDVFINLNHITNVVFMEDTGLKLEIRDSWELFDVENIRICTDEEFIEELNKKTAKYI